MLLGHLKKIELRAAWAHEEHGFSKWLAEPNNIELLGNEIGIELTNIKTEAPSGRYSVDLVAEEEGTGRKVIIENQLETTNHDHLGKIITYASGFDAEVIIWIVKDYRDEHKQAVDWLNENTNEKINFFLLRIELWQIGDSPYAPKFNIISQPNNWAKTLKAAQKESDLSETKLMQLEFWKGFQTFGESKSSHLRFRKVLPQHWYNISYGNSNSHIALTVNSQNKQITCDIYIPDSKELYQFIFNSKEEIENELNEILNWQELPMKKASRIRLTKNLDFTDETRWHDCYTWMLEKAEAFYKIFGKYKLN